METRWKPISVVFLVVIVLTVSVSVIVKHMHSKKVSAQAEFFEILKIEDEGVRLVKLEEFAEAKKNHDLSIQALMALGQYHYTKGDFAKASSSYEKAVNGSKNSLVYFVALDAWAPILIQLDRADEAAGFYLEASKMKLNPWPYRSKYEAASIYVLNGEKEKAEAIYNKLINDEKSPAGIKIKSEEDLLWLSAKKD